MAVEKFLIALVQMSCGPEPEQNLAEGARPRRRRRRPGRAGGLPARTFSDPVFLPARRRRPVRPGGDRFPDRRQKCSGGSRARKIGVVLIASLFEKRAPGVYHNTAAIFDTDGTLNGIYRKMHIPDDPLYYEKFYFTPGRPGLSRLRHQRRASVGTLVCWDQWYPEGARLTALQGAHVLFYPTAIGWHPGGESRVRRGPARRLAHHPARPRHRQRRLRGGRQSRRI